MNEKADEPKPDERQYHDTTSAYSLPNDNVEHSRLEAQAQALEMLMFNDIFHAPVVEPKRILDVGCGTGRATVQLAQKFPQSQVIGIDLSPVPALYPKPKNVEYIQGDVNQLVEAGDESLRAGSFDYIFGRLLVLGMTDWRDYFANVSSILAPGGWLEVQEYEISQRDANGNFISDQLPAMREFLALNVRKGLTPSIALEAPQIMRDCGLVNVHEKPYKVPYLEDPSLPQAAMISKQAGQHAIGLRSLWFKLGEGVYSQEELHRLSQEMIDEWTAFKPGTHTNFTVITGRKESVDNIAASRN